MTRYTVINVRSGQPRPYADTEHEYVVCVEQLDHDGKAKPWFPYGRLTEETWQRDWAKNIVRALCRGFREPGDQDGLDDWAAHFAPTLKSLSIDAAKGEIRALIVEAYTD